MTKKAGKRRFKKNSIIKSQLPSPGSKKAGKLYYIQNITDKYYVIYDWPEKKKKENVTFKYIDEGFYLDGKYVYNYMEEENAENLSERNQSSSRNRSSKQKRSDKPIKQSSARNSQSGTSSDNRRKKQSKSSSQS